jgi:hypothetical protein
MAKVEVRDIEIAYNIDGSGEPVVLIGGLAAVNPNGDFEARFTSRNCRFTGSSSGTEAPSGLASPAYRFAC